MRPSRTETYSYNGMRLTNSKMRIGRRVMIVFKISCLAWPATFQKQLWWVWASSSERWHKEKRLKERIFLVFCEWRQRGMEATTGGLYQTEIKNKERMEEKTVEDLSNALEYRQKSFSVFKASEYIKLLRAIFPIGECA